MTRSLTHSPLAKIGFFSPLAGVGVDCGYGYAAVQLITAWQRMGIPVWAYDREAPVAFNMGQPHYYEVVDGAFNIGYTPWESSHVPEAWIKYMNLMDEVWTTCEENARWYRAAGVSKPVKVLHHGLNRDHWPLAQRRLKDGEPFRFLHVGGDARRKGADIVYKVFRELFKGNDKFELTLKARRLEFGPMGSNVHHIDEVLSTEDLTQLHLDHHAMIYPTRGEGFGLIPFQAAATGMPTAVTNWSGPADYIKFCYPIRVEEMVTPDYVPHEGLWAKPDEDSVAYWMESFARSPDYFFRNAYRKATLMDSWSWDNIAEFAVKSMTDSLTQLPS